MKLIIEIDDKRIKGIKLLAKEQDIATPYPTLEQIIANGIPLDKHDEEIIAETVESIWGKPPYTELLDKIRTEITEEIEAYRMSDWEANDLLADGLQMALNIIDGAIEEGVNT